MPLGASPPVSAMLKPILIGSPVCADAGPTSSVPAISASIAPATTRILIYRACFFLPLVLVGGDLIGNGDKPASVPIPSFASLCGTLACELRKLKDTRSLLT